jgi:hypothetical protein
VGLLRACTWTRLLISLCWVPATVHAQSPDGGPRVVASDLMPWSPAALAKPLRVIERQARLSRAEKGALIGALALGTTAAVIRATMCERGESCTGPTIGWGLMGATVGAVVGGLVLGAGE